MEVLTNNETPATLFPNGGWDVHHHIFERMALSMTIICLLKAKILCQLPSLTMHLIGT